MKIHKTVLYLTPLSKRNATEDFSECYALYITDPQRLEKAPKKYNFSHQVVFIKSVEIESPSFYLEGLR